MGSDFALRGRPEPLLLSPAELEVLLFVSHGLSVRDIARARVVELSTVRRQTKAIRRKLAAKNMAQAVAIGMRHGLIR